MNDKQDFDRAVDRWLDDGSDATPPEVLNAVFLAVRSTPQERDFRISWRTSPMKQFAYALAGVAALAVGIAAVSALSPSRVGFGPTPAPDPSVDLGIFEPVAGQIVYGNAQGIWGVDPAAADPAPAVQLTSEAGIPLGWSRDGTRLLIMRQSSDERVGAMPAWHLFVLHADGTETQLTERAMASLDATISPDGSRVVFAGAVETAEPECCTWALHAVDADGGPADMLLDPVEEVVEAPTFAPDGKRIAYVSGAGDHSHSVWLMDADGGDAHQIVSNESTAAAGHVRGLAWSPAGDRIALALGGTLYTFATDGTQFMRVAGSTPSCTAADPCGGVDFLIEVTSPYWSPDGSQIAYTRGCIDGAGAASRDGCMLAIADADGSNMREFGFAASGPWHPGTLKSGAGG